ncbi:MAG: hypothetical protein KKF44_04360 [Nanoarchaeota archaeon]|nr:hypothetical protein [Nanoarchaeota archaeon]
MEDSIEKIRVKGLTLVDLLDKKFLDLLKQSGLKVSPVNIAFFADVPEPPIVLSHENPKEKEEKLLHIESKDPKKIEKFKEILTKYAKK